MSVYPTDGGYFSEKKLPESLQFLFRLSRLFGLLPYNASHSISRGWLVYSIFPMAFMICGSTGTCIYSLYFTDYLQKNPSVFTMTLLYLTQQGMQVLCLFCHILSVGLYKDDFDSVLKPLPEWAYTGEKSKFAGFWTNCGVLFLLLYYICTPVLAETSWTNNIWYFFVFFNEICIYFILIQFCTFLEIIETQLKNLTLLLTRNRKLVPLTETHYTLVSTAQTVNSVYSWQILILCTLIFINFVSWLFNAMQDVMSTTNEIKPFMVLLKILYCIWQIVNIYFIAGSCEGVVENVSSHILQTCT
ncbi:Hypothetical protein NTJ_00386 [Nesidiocoris tenuis]|uniref:Gustatory receptor n=1 Tax=Nesidiocoris tenuis TaxID=355587 RepID=A0ABN7A5Y6_9HEMI|nr:Hypothetical protein NTJ_00386 [Nesidiocoris tenuis]